MKLFNSALFALLLSFSVTGCVYYSHSAHTNIRQDSFDQSFQYLKTESLMVGVNYAETTDVISKSAQNSTIDSNKPLTDEEKQAILENIRSGNSVNTTSLNNSYLPINKPTFYALSEFVNKKYGKDAVVGNVVWDVKNTLFFWNSQNIESVTFDVYLKR
jgi:hypothetical protein